MHPAFQSLFFSNGYCSYLKRSCVSGQSSGGKSSLRLEWCHSAWHCLSMDSQEFSEVHLHQKQFESQMHSDLFKVLGNIIMSSFINNSVLLSLCLSSNIVVFMVL